MTSEGRWALPENAFSAHIMRTVTRTLGCKSGSALIVASAAAAPAISLFIAVIKS